MNEIMSQFLTSEVQTVLFALLGIVVVLYLLSIFWAARDARARGFGWAWGLLSVVPIVGLVAYCMIRPPLLKADREEQDLELALKQRELMKFGDCAKCGYPVEADYVLCPNCHTRLKNLCPTCHHALDPAWTVCPYCTTKIKYLPVSEQGSVKAQPILSLLCGEGPAGLSVFDSGSRIVAAGVLR